MNDTLALQLVPLAKELDENKVTPGVLGFIVFALLGVAVWLLLKSMNRHLGKVDFKEGPAAGEDAEGERTDGEPTDGAREPAGEAREPRETGGPRG